MANMLKPYTANKRSAEMFTPGVAIVSMQQGYFMQTMLLANYNNSTTDIDAIRAQA